MVGTLTDDVLRGHLLAVGSGLLDLSNSALAPAGLRFYWERLGLDYVLLEWAAAGKATIGQEQQVRDDLWRWEKRLGEWNAAFGSVE